MTVFTAIALVLVGVGDGESYTWPLDVPRVLTSSFGEYRAGGYHMGVDLRTGAMPRDVRAVADGHVSRVRVSPNGYGKAVYLKLDDGNTVVYAHLSGFSGALGDYVRAAQHARERYAVDLYPKKDAIRFSRGEVVAKSGQTGIGAAHLHFELRDGNGAPINPLGAGAIWPDTVAPRVRKILVAPADVESRVNGDYLPVVLEVSASADGGWSTEPVSVSGSVFLGVDAVDTASAPSTRLGIGAVRTWTADGELFSFAHDRLTYANDQDGVVAYHPFMKRSGRFLLQWRWPGNDSEPYRGGDLDGVIHVSEAPIDVRMRVSDFHENAVEVLIPIVPETGGAAVVTAVDPLEAKRSESPGRVRVEHLGGWLAVTVEFDGAEMETPALVWRAKGGHVGPFRLVGPGLFRATFAPGPDDAEVPLTVMHSRLAEEPVEYTIVRRGGGDRSVTLGDVRLGVASDSAYGVLIIRQEETAARAPRGLRAQGKAYTLWPENAPIDEAVEVSLPVPTGASDGERVGVYRKVGKGKWELMDTTRKGDRLEVQSKRLGVFAVMEDVSAPRIRRVRPRDEATVTTRRPAIRAVVEDAGSGIGGYRGTLNGQWLLMAYDPERSTLEWERDEDLPLGSNELVLTLRDRAGNVSEVRRTIEVVEAPAN